MILGQSQLIQESFRRKRLKKINNKSIVSTREKNAFTHISEIQKEEFKLDLLYSRGSLILKFGLLVLFSASFVNLGLASHQRVNRNLELSYLLEKESQKFNRLKARFDELFTIGGEHSFLKEQDQWIAPNSVRVIWR